MSLCSYKRRGMGVSGLTKGLVAICAMLFFIASPCSGQEEEKTYTISLHKTAGIKQEIRKIGDKKVLAEPHKVKKGEHLWQILRQRGLLNKGNLGTLLSVLKDLNSSLTNLDLIHPGQKILIPLKIVPIKGISSMRGQPAHVRTNIVELEGMKLENYTVQPGDSIIKVVMGKYSIPPARLYTEYLQLVRKLNPSLKDLNKIYPGQKVRLPIYSPAVVRKPIKRQVAEKPSLLKGNKVPSPYLAELKSLFLAIGEDWKDTGEHFIPLRSGGQIDLKAASFPLITFLSGRRVILDAYDKLPDRVRKLIEESWSSYRVVPLGKEDSLANTLQEIISKAGYVRVLNKGETLDFDGPIPVSVSAHWVLVRSEKPLKNGFGTVVLALGGQRGMEQVSPAVEAFLEAMGIKVISFPPATGSTDVTQVKVDEIDAGKGVKDLVEAILRATGHKFKEDVGIPVMGNEKSDFNLVVKADIFLRTRKQDSIIDLTGIEKDMVSFLKDHEFRVLQLAGVTDPEAIVADTLGFLEIPFDRGLHSLNATQGSSALQIKIKIQGVVFADADKNAVIATPLFLSSDLKQFLAQKGFRILQLTTL